MRISLLLTAVCGAAFITSPAVAQSAATPEPSVDSYLCTYAGKCGDAAASDETTREAPATKGFSLARPTQTQPAPATKGFSLARPAQAEKAPATKGFSLAQPTKARAATATTRAKRVPTTRARTEPAAAVAAVAPVAVGAGVSRRADLMVSFELNSDKLTPAGEARAKMFAETMLRPELLDKRFLIAGHTDSVGSRAGNLDLSRRRAEAVADYLKQAGVAPARIEVRGEGSSEPLPGLRANDPANRRVEAELIS